MSQKRPPLGEDDLTPLLQAAASRSLDTCLRGARGLAVLGDSRAFGLLLQLSREQDPAARGEVCRALAALADPRAADRLRSLLYDLEAAVRDAAFTALAKLQADRPLDYASAGLSSAFEDVRRRGLESLVRFLRESPADAGRAGPALDLLARALNDSSAGVRGEAFKAALNLPAGGGGLHTLRFILQSVHSDVRLEVLVAALAQVQEPWAWNFLLEFYNDSDPALRHEAFTAATAKNKELPPLEAALLAQYPDVRRLAVEALIKKHTGPAQGLLIRALSDADKGVRQLALGSLVGDDAQGPLTEALASPHADVRVRAALALARHGEASALAPLLALATAPEPPQKERQADWLALTESALEGLAELGDLGALAALPPLLQSGHASVRKLAAQALAGVAPPHHVETLRQALQHADAQVKYHAALGLAYAGDPLVASLVFSEPAARILSLAQRLVAAFMLGPVGEDQLAVFLDATDETRDRALLLLMLLEMADRQGAPVRCLTCLSARSPRVRLAAARALERFADPAAFLDHVVRLVNDRGDEPPWKISAETVGLLAELIARGSPAVRARTAHLLAHLAEKEPAAWEQAWALHTSRFAAEIRSLEEAARQRPVPAAQYTPEQLQELTFGAYVGLVREQGGSAATGQGSELQVVRVRQTALTRVQEMGAAGRLLAARPVLMQALGDPNQAVRLQAFDQLATLGVDAEALGAAALGAGHTDVGVRGLERLTGGGTSAHGQAVLEEALRTRTDDLATEAAKLLAARRGLVAVAGLALEAAHEPLRRQAVDWLAAAYDEEPAARDLLRQALQSGHRKTATTAAFALAGKKDPAAFDALVRLLRKAKEAGHQRRVIEALATLGDQRAPDALLDRIEQDPEGSALADELFDAAGQFRRPETADRLLAIGSGGKGGKALEAALVVSGFDQAIEDPEDENADRRWEQKQFPRHVAILARLMKQAADLKANRALKGFLPAARWARGKEVDPVLAVLTVYADDDVRRSAVEAVGWRLRKRGGPAESLVKALQSRDPATQFMAAEGLALAGRAEGLNVLMAAVDLQEDFALRQRAVRALGELGDARALDLVSKLARDPEHVLRAEAVEAIGHFRHPEKAEEIRLMLVDLARLGGRVAGSALRGLRRLDHPEGWQVIRRAADRNADTEAVGLLGFDDDPATRALLLRLLEESPRYAVQEAALVAARRLWDAESLEPDYAAVRNANLDPELQDALFLRLQEHGDSRRLLEIVPRLPGDAGRRLKGILLGRQPLPVAAARSVVAGPDAAAAGVAAHLLGRAGSTEAGEAVAAAAARWWGEWDKGRQEETRRGGVPGKLVGPLLEPLRSLLWSAGRLGVAVDTLRAVATTRPNVAFDRPLRREAVAALAANRPGNAALTVLAGLVGDEDPKVRATVATAFAAGDPDRRASLARPLLSDRVAFNRLAAGAGEGVAPVLRDVAGLIHYQGVAVPHLVRRLDVAALAAAADDSALPEPARLGAVEGLAAVASEAAEMELVRLAGAAENPEELRKAAGRGLRRSRRARQSAAREVAT